MGQCFGNLQMFEAFDVLKGKTDPDADDLERVPYINAVISESNSSKKKRHV
jgi:hypothetical protein